MDTKKILIVDDQKDMRVLLGRLLEKKGYCILEAGDGEEALWKVIENKPDLVLTDVLMPKMNGIEFIKRLRALEDGKDVSVIVISKRALMVNTFDEGEIEAFFAKPFDMEALFEKIGVIFDKRDLMLKLADMEERKKGDAAPSDKQDGRRVEVCKRCGKECDDDATHCSNCGHTEFFIKFV